MLCPDVDCITVQCKTLLYQKNEHQEDVLLLEGQLSLKLFTPSKISGFEIKFFSLLKSIDHLRSSFVYSGNGGL